MMFIRGRVELPEFGMYEYLLLQSKGNIRY